MNKYFLLVVSVFFMVLTSCNSDLNTDEIIETPDLPVLSATNNLLTRTVTAENGFHMACFQVVYPFSLIDVNDEQYNVTSDTDFNVLVADSTILKIVDFLYPISIEKEDGAGQVTINNGLELFNVFASCVPDSVVTTEGDFVAYLINGENSCYNLQYPLALKDVENQTVFAQDESDFNELLTSGLYFFQFPLQLTKNDGTTLTVVDGNTLFDALIACNPYVDSTYTSGAVVGCYTIVFPCNVRLINGTNKAIANSDEFTKVLISNKFEDFTFPLTIKDENGIEYIANDQAEFDALLQLCDNNPLPVGSAFRLLSASLDTSNVSGPCFTIQFPIQIVLMVDSTINQVQTINSTEELLITVLGQGWLSANLVYPVDLKLKDNTIVGIKNETELDTLIENCD